MKQRYVTRKPCASALWGVFDHEKKCFVRLACLSRGSALRAAQALNERNSCAHDDHEHGICIDCGADITDRLVDLAEYRADCAQGGGMGR